MRDPNVPAREQLPRTEALVEAGILPVDLVVSLARGAIVGAIKGVKHEIDMFRVRHWYVFPEEVAEVEAYANSQSQHEQ